VVQKMDLLVETKVFGLNYARAEDIKAKIESVITKDLGEVQVDERTNKVIVTDLPKNMERLDEMIVAFDERSREVMIQAKIIEITLNDQYKMGIDWEGIFRGMNDLDFKGSFSLATQGTLSPGMEVSVGTLAQDRDNWTGFVQFLRKVGDVNLLSSPRVTAMNNEEAKILIGSSEPYVTTTTTTPASGPTTVAEEVTFIDVGVKLYVTPTINHDGFVTMKIKPEVSSVSNTLTTSQNNTIPIVSTTQAETSVMLKDGVSIVIAGLIKDERSSTVHKMPGLGSIPILGLIFQKTVEEVEKKEIIIVLTPHIITGDKMITEYPPTPTVEKSKFTVAMHPLLEKRDFPDLKKRLGNDPFAYPDWRVGVSETKKSRSLSYEDIVRMQTLRYLKLNYPDETLNGEVGVSFVLERNGKLKGSPEITKKSNPAVEEIVLRSIEGAAPFPPFPDSIADKDKQFTIDIAYE
ncbi:MAG: TonB C-terminal domain-containing protein, partial [Candidatus Omnitrophica bacterium]|nr:TonB C-terminal domain-containing protein [Candidatus Omnitrophota bacterium]